MNESELNIYTISHDIDRNAVYSLINRGYKVWIDRINNRYVYCTEKGPLYNEYEEEQNTDKE